MISKKGIVYFIAFLFLTAILVSSLYLTQFDISHLIEYYDEIAEADDHEGHDHEHHEPVHSHDHHEHVHHHHHDHESEQESFVALTNDQIREKDIEIRQASPGQLTMILSTRGKVVLHPDRLAYILPKVSGVVQEAKKNVGEFVRAGEVIAVLESREIAEAKASYLAALGKENLAFNLLSRESRLYEKGISAEKEYIIAKAAYEDTKITSQLALQKLYTLGFKDREIDQLITQSNPYPRLYEVRAPIDGIIISRDITKGEFIDSKKVYEIADLRTVWVEVGIYPKDLRKTREGQFVEVILPNENYSAPARVVYLSPIIQEESITTKAIVELDNYTGCWCPGSLVNVNIATEKISVPLIASLEAIQNIEGKDFIFVLSPHGFEKKEVKLGRKDGYYAEVLAGLEPGESYAVNQTFLLKAELGKNSIAHEH
jgi:cobalt-zinc-cadmium efflux system membrane fusion protein